MILVWLILVAVILFFLEHFLVRCQQLRPPSPINPLLVSCYLPQLLYKPQVALQKLARIYAPLMSFQIGDKLMVVASSPEAAKQLFRTHDRMLSGRHLPSVYHQIPGSMDSSIVLSPECGESWKLLRFIGQKSMFSAAAMELSAWIRKGKVMDMVNHLRAKEGEIVHLENIMFVTLTNIISTILTSRNLLDIEGQDTKDFKDMMALVNEVFQKTVSTFGVVDFFPILKGIDFWSKRKATDLYRKIKLTWGAIINERRCENYSNSTTQDHFLDIVLADSKFSDDQIGNVLTELLVAATDTSITTTVWLMKELIGNYEMLSRVRKEIARAVEGDNQLNESLLSQCQYFQACIKETLRLHPLAPLLVPRRAIETFKVNNYIIPKDSMVLVNGWAIAQDPVAWEDATIFKPERFLDSKIGYRGTHFEFLPLVRD